MTLSDHGHDTPATPQAVVPHLSRREVMDATKEAVKELIREQVTEVGWWAIKTVAFAIVGAGLLFALWLKGWGKVGGG